jgi:hypothetical protein
MTLMAAVERPLMEAIAALLASAVPHQQALSAYAVALAAGAAGRSMTGFSEVAPLALMSGSIDLVRA